MGAITRAAANNITTSGVILPAAITNASVASITTLSQLPAEDDLTLISTQTPSGASSVEFTSGLDSTYKTYIFKYYLHNAAGSHLFFNLSTDGGSNYNVVKTSTAVRVYHNEADSGVLLDYLDGSQSRVQETGNQYLIENQSSDADAIASGWLYLFNPSSTTYVKHFLGTNNTMEGGPSSNRQFTGGYANTTSAINAIKFLPNSSTFTGTIRLYGIS
jgi:hypothetical protein